MPSASTRTVVRFPASRAGRLSACPHCGTLTDARRIGRLLWAYCEDHESRWVVRDFGQPPPGESPTDVARSLELLARYAEISA